MSNPINRVLAEHDFSEDVNSSLEKLRDFDLKPVTMRLEEEGHSEAEKLEEEFRKFAALTIINEDTTVVPSERLDIFWHKFIMDTRRYQRFCDEVLGSFLHHEVSDPREVEEVEPDFESYEKTLEQYREYFGDVEETVWTQKEAEAAMCGASNDQETEVAMCGGKKKAEAAMCGGKSEA